MVSRKRFFQVINALLVALVFSLFLTLPAYAGSAKGNFPDLNSFVTSVTNGDESVLRGVFVQGVMAFPIVQQPAGSPGFVSQNKDQLTQFGLAAQAGNVGLLAHNYLSGSSFSKLKSGDVIVLVYGDGHTEKFLVTEIVKYQALDPNNTNSKFIDLKSQTTLSAEELFAKVYRGEKHVTFQTCIEKDGNLSWGRLFIIAVPMAK